MTDNWKNGLFDKPDAGTIDIGAQLSGIGAFSISDGQVHFVKKDALGLVAPSNLDNSLLGRRSAALRSNSH